jgi:hypothetical protein
MPHQLFLKCHSERARAKNPEEARATHTLPGFRCMDAHGTRLFPFICHPERSEGSAFTSSQSDDPD